MDVDTAAAWETHKMALRHLVDEGRLTPAMAADLCSDKGQ